MASTLLLRILVAARPGIQSGKFRMGDIVEEYFKQSGGKTIDEGERAIIENEFIEFAPSNVTTPDAFKGFLNEGEIVAPTGPSVKPKLTLGEGKINYPAMEEKLGVKLRGDETFEELLEIEKGGQGIGSMIPKQYYGYNRGKGGEYNPIPYPLRMDDIIASEKPIDKSNIKNWAQRDDYAQFIRKMRDKDFKNKDIRNLVKDSGGNIAEGKRAATSLKRAAEMVADTKVKQEMLSNLDEMKLERGPRWWKGDDQYDNIEGPMGADTRADMTKRLNNKVYHGVMEDLDGMLGEEKSYEVLKNLSTFSGNRRGYNNDPDAFIQAIKEELEFNNIKYDMTFWENYVDEIMQLTTPEVPVFRSGGLV
jgi:hypothetical protein